MEERKTAKTKLTKCTKLITRLMAEGKVEEVQKSKDQLLKNFAVFEECHNTIHNDLTKEEDIEASDNYFSEVEDRYVEILNKAHMWLRDLRKADENYKPQPLLSRELEGILNLPKKELEPYDGNPMKYMEFFSLFEESVEKHTSDHQIMLTRLLQYTSGEANDAIRSCSMIGGKEGYLQARKILESRFGNGDLISESIITSIRSKKSIKTPDEMRKLADGLDNSYIILSRLGKLSEVESQSCIIDIVNRLPAYVIKKWRKFALEAKDKVGKYPNFIELVKFMKKEAMEALDPVYGHNKFKHLDASFQSDNFSTTVDTRSDSHTSGQNRYTFRNKCNVCEETHPIWLCSTFKSMSVKDRSDVVTKHNLCKNCLKVNHNADQCRRPSYCTQTGCMTKHSKFLHNDNEVQIPTVESDNTIDKTEPRASLATGVENSVNHGETHVYLPVIPVKVNGNKDTRLALLDTASNTTFCTRKLLRDLNIKGCKIKYMLNTLDQPDMPRQTEVVKMTLFSEDGKDCLSLSNVFVVDNIPIKSKKVDISSYPHLQNIPINTYASSEVDLLIGQDHCEALIPLEIRKGQRGEAYAVRTLFGWCLNGPISTLNIPGKQVVNHFITANSIEQQVCKLWEIENEIDHEAAFSVNDERVISLWDENVQFKEGHYVLPIPWKDNVAVPNNYYAAFSRLNSLKISLEKRNLMEKYESEIEKMVKKGYAEKIPNDEINKVARKWYLPHHAVLSEKKPGKLRIVYDCAAKFQGESLNDKCFQGPDLNNKLLHVLLRFRQHKYAIMADIEAMYYQVHVSPQDKDVLRFIWYVDNEIVHYRMKSHVFGGVWCASAATYALRRTLVDGKSCDPLIANTIKRSFYVDDCLKSVETKEEAKKVINQTRQVLKEGGFRLTKFIVNDKSLFYECVPAEDRSDESPNFNFGSNSKALGIRWHVKKDVFFFLLDLHNGGNVTRRKILQVVSSMFDPLGLVNPVMLGGKLVFQMTTRHKLLWDDQLPNEIIMQWYSWVKSLLQLHEVDIPRCVNHLPVGETVFELHHFSDASERAYGSCTYLKCIHKSGETQITLMLSKSKIAPLKVISIPRLELQAAVLSAKVNAMCLKELDFEISASFFWVDSEIVLKYIKSETKRFHVFVANRVSLIRSLSHPHQWNFVPGDQNPADALTRGLEPNQLKQYGWFTGPLFLKTVSKLDVKETDQGNVVDHTDENDPEVKKDIKSSFVTTSSENPLDRLISHFSSWYKLKRAVSWLIRAKDVLLKRKVSADRSITAKEMKIAEDLIVKHVQGQYYSVEIECLQQNNPLRKSSNILSLCPILDESSILRVGGRMKDADIPFDSKHPCILPYNHEISKMIIGDCHEQAHLGVEWTLSIVRQKYWIVKARSMIKVIGKKCVVCQRLFKKPNVQKMSNLPPERIEPFKPPFTYVGLDCFGPFAVKLGRSQVKRYGCIFTCFTTRAVHIEKIDSLEADTFLNAFRRFVARRGSPKKVWSDNGTNFIGSQSEIKKATMQLNDKQIKDFSRKNEIEWHFNPPHASHMGGVWERLIRTIRKVLVVTLRNTTIRDDVLSTLFCEAEAILNSRPLTKVSDDPQDISALTPNHLLLMRSGSAPPPGVFVQNDVYAKRWKYVQFLADQFWKRWVKEYLPELQRRVKWHNIKDNVEKGDLVLLVDEKVPRGLWPLALVLDVNEGRDGLVRSVKVRTKSNVFVRPITKVVKLEMSAD